MALPKKELSSHDFRSTKRTWIRYSKPDPKRLPPGSVADFEWKDYSPAVFRFDIRLRVMFTSYFLSICSTVNYYLYKAMQ